MASFRQRGKMWYYRYDNTNGKQIELKGHWDYKTTQAMAQKAELKVYQIRRGLISPKDAEILVQDSIPLNDHINACKSDILAKGSTAKHAEHTTNRVRRLIAVMMEEEAAFDDHRRLPPDERSKVADKIAEAIAQVSLSDLKREKVQAALAKLKELGWSLQTCNHYRAGIRAFSKWCSENDRLNVDPLHALKGYNAEEDPRHGRRTVFLEEFHRLIETTNRAGDYHGLSGPTRALCYRTAAVTGLRYNELSSLTRESFDWDVQTVTVTAAYAKNGKTATLYLPAELAEDLKVYVADIEPGAPLFELPEGKGARVLRHDLKAAGIPYVDPSNLFFDFHSLRCELATLADAAGVSPRVVQDMMRASSLELVSRYTRTRPVDIETGASKLPSLKPRQRKNKSRQATGPKN
jgi:integrase